VVWCLRKQGLLNEATTNQQKQQWTRQGFFSAVDVIDDADWFFALFYKMFCTFTFREMHLER
jgi:hypothetical protein